MPTVGIGAGAGCDAQVLVWTDMAGLTPGAAPKFVKRYADLRGELCDAATRLRRRGPRGHLPRPGARLQLTARPFVRSCASITRMPLGPRT